MGTIVVIVTDGKATRLTSPVGHQMFATFLRLWFQGGFLLLPPPPTPNQTGAALLTVEDDGSESLGAHVLRLHG